MSTVTKIIAGFVVVAVSFSITLLILDNRKDACLPTPALGVRIYFKKTPDSADVCSGEKFLASGWGEIETGGVWTLGPQAVFRIPTIDWPEGDVTAIFDASSYIGLGFHQGVQKIHVFIDGQKITEWNFSTGSSPPDTSFIITRQARGRSNTVNIVFQIDPPFNARALGKAPDDRELGLSLRSVVFEKAAR